VSGAEVEQKPPRTSNVFSHGDDFPKRIETKSESVALVEESPFLFVRQRCIANHYWVEPGDENIIKLNLESG
jgi:hypothetical protein